MTIPISELLNILTKDLPYNNQILSLYKSNGELILSTSSEINFDNYFNKLNSQNITPVIDSITNIDPYVVTSNKIPLTNWVLLSAIPNSNVYTINSLYMDNDKILNEIKDNSDFKNITLLYEGGNKDGVVNNNYYLVSK